MIRARPRRPRFIDVFFAATTNRRLVYAIESRHNAIGIVGEPFSPPTFVIEALGRVSPASTLLLNLIFKSQ
jgi:hypothetical protein